MQPALTELEGAFTLALWDGRQRELLLVNDRFGLYPHFVLQFDAGFAFAPEMKGLIAATTTPVRLDLTAVAEYLRFQQLLGDRTWIEGMQLLPPASLLRYSPDDDRLTIARYWDWDAIGHRPDISFDEAVDECIRLFDRGIDAMTAPPGRIGVYLSGGLDSRTILGFLDRGTPVTTITFGAPDCRDMVYAAQLACNAGSRHHPFPLNDGRWIAEYAPLHLALTEGQHSWVHAHGISTLEAARTLIDTQLSGFAGETVFGGYSVFDDHRRDRAYLNVPDEAALVQRLYEAFCHHLTWPGLTEPEASALLSGHGDARLRPLAFGALRQEVAASAHYPADRRADYFLIAQHDRRLLQNMIVFARSAIDVRCPFFDYSLIDHVFSLPEHIRATPDLYRAIITRRLPHLATVPYERDDLLPHANPLIRGMHALTQRGKRRINRHVPSLFPQRPRLYVDYERLLRTDLRDWAEAILFDPRTLDRGFFDPAAVTLLWERHLSGHELWTLGKIAPLITIELVVRSLFDPANIPAGDRQLEGKARCAS